MLCSGHSNLDNLLQVMGSQDIPYFPYCGECVTWFVSFSHHVPLYLEENSHLISCIQDTFVEICSSREGITESRGYNNCGPPESLCYGSESYTGKESQMKLCSAKKYSQSALLALHHWGPDVGPLDLQDPRDDLL